MATWQLKLDNPSFCPCAKYIRDRSKTVEGRTYSGARRGIQKGDFVEFKLPSGDFLVCEVTFVHLYPTLEDYLREEGVHNAIPGVTFERALELYNTGGVDPPKPWSDPDQREQCRHETGYGFMGIGLYPLPELISD